ncbi:GNAT family N-acetyltransferase [Hyphococcus sp.]|jgi:RimJ/RimL family protein N-acetyltransferase|uniref:GNAT family N-acetyltransferase n=1 Tax=Hyphococcus sp. TaxID=2038636 RepID=UPI003D0E2849
MRDLSNWRGCPAPDLKKVRGRYVAIEPAVFPDCAPALFSVLGGSANDGLWSYIPIGPFQNADAFSAAMSAAIAQQNWKTQLFRDAVTDAPLGMASYMRIRPEAGSAEVGCVVFSKALQKTPAATEAMYLMAKHLFDDLGYRRYEWKCNNANEASKRAALRLGFSFEGVFRQDQVVKGKNRDTAWYSMIDKEWPAVKCAFEAWLAPENFDVEGRQKRSLKAIRENAF